MHDVLQQGLEAWAHDNAAVREAAILCASAVLYLLGVAWVVVAVGARARITWATVARVAFLTLVAYLASIVLTGVVADPRPYIVTHTRPLMTVGHDNGFPSDHTLLAATLTASLWWIARRPLPLFALGTVLIALGRLSVGAHHTLDVVGSIVIALCVAGLAGTLPLPDSWSHPIFSAARGARESTPVQ